jgi:nucleoside-diphosphate-sugar epimerase
MKTLIIGGSGFVGSFLIRELSEHEINNLDKRSSPFFNNITSKGDIRFLDEIVIHKDTESIVLLAAEHRDDVSPTSLYYDVNVEGTRNVLKAMDKSGVKNLIFSSSVAVYGLNK